MKSSSRAVSVYMGSQTHGHLCLQLFRGALMYVVVVVLASIVLVLVL